MEIAGSVLSDSSTQLFKILSAKLKNLKHVNFSHNTITSIAAGHIVNVCNWNNGLEKFELSHCTINGIGLCTIVDSLCEIRKLKYLDFSFYHFTLNVAGKLVHLLQSCTTLETLKLAGV